MEGQVNDIVSDPGNNQRIIQLFSVFITYVLGRKY